MIHPAPWCGPEAPDTTIPPQVPAGSGRQRLRTAWQALLSRRDNLRAAFRHEGSNRPVQLVPHEVTVPVSEVGLTGQGDRAYQSFLRSDRMTRARRES